ncbi:DUF1320 domain-containing protein [Rhodoplanes sp. TEM]|uniref:DUF1320 domain-containing protein n=1 Tax=Rhodoplanes tepidamans TaxID=200616 RepID=A0ABT5JF99_RHOTP|nr:MULTISPECIES: DUF1320 domain-containing protein [Rhodoplanes]MDC7787969.1 DUF1320 domain-containing protein [Rhodoplanes tepidamans]MDC7984809.1 DUF1320 domain-containing protein [Rhodoplanes sp. TEM]MDQ0358398.1 phage gp36-like protein [Rhodoplanes tepidamans]
MTAYATVADMVSRFGETEVLRFSAGDGALPETIQPERIERAIGDASALIDSYLRRRYAVPLAVVPQAVERAACVLARYDLAQGGDREPTEQMRLARKEAIAWLEGIAAGTVTLEGVATLSAGSSARVQDRDAVFGSASLRDW